MHVLLLLLALVLVVTIDVLAKDMPQCGEFVVVPSKYASHGYGGFTPSCFENKAVTFDTCKRLLSSRYKEGCNALSYTHYSCSLHDRTLPSWQPLPTPVPVHVPVSDLRNNVHEQRMDKGGRNKKHAYQDSSILQILLLSPDIDTCISPSTNPTLSDNQREQHQRSYPVPTENVLPACLHDPLLAPLSHSASTTVFPRESFTDNIGSGTLGDSSGNSNSNSNSSSSGWQPPAGLHNWLALPRLGIIMAVTSDWVKDHALEMASIVNNWKCYAITHNYAFHLHIMKPPSVVEKFYHTRHGDVIDTHLHNYRYLLILDSDNLVVNMSRSLDHIVNLTPFDRSHPHAAVDLFLHMREGGEVTASTYFIRNSAFSRCFVQYWRSMSPSDDELKQANINWVETPNNDNGDLIAAVMNLIHPDIALRCSAALRTHNSNTNRHQTYDTKILLCFRLFRGALVNISHYVPQMKVFFIREDFFRMHSGHTMTKENMLLRKDVYCHQHDIIVHGWKDLGTRYWPRGNDNDKNTESYPSCDVDAFRKGGGGNTLCRWLKHEVEFAIVQKHCYWRSPLCLSNHGNDSRSTNTDTKKSVALQRSSGGVSRGDIDSNVCVRDQDSGGGCWERERMNLSRWLLCLLHQVCDPYLSVVQIRKNLSLYTNLSGPW